MPRASEAGRSDENDPKPTKTGSKSRSAAPPDLILANSLSWDFLARGSGMQFGQLKRRELIALLGGTAAAWPLVARAQQPSKLPTIGFLGAASASAWSQRVTGFEQRLRELGWIDGHTISITYRWAEGRSERYPEIASEFIKLNVDVIVTSGGAVPAVKRATSNIPIVFAVASNPVESGLVASLARPGGNVTGLSSQQPDLVGKRLEFLREVLPGFRRGDHGQYRLSRRHVRDGRG
jgi:hypothetical protein